MWLYKVSKQWNPGYILWFWLPIKLLPVDTPETHWKWHQLPWEKFKFRTHPPPPESEQPADPCPAHQAHCWFEPAMNKLRFFPVFPIKNDKQMSFAWLGGWALVLLQAPRAHPKKISSPALWQWLLVMTFWKDFGFGHKVVSIECYLLFEKFVYLRSQCHIYTSEN